jgi:hypothetical protein
VSTVLLNVVTHTHTHTTCARRILLHCFVLNTYTLLCCYERQVVHFTVVSLYLYVLLSSEIALESCLTDHSVVVHTHTNITQRRARRVVLHLLSSDNTCISVIIPTQSTKYICCHFVRLLVCHVNSLQCTQTRSHHNTHGTMRLRRSWTLSPSLQMLAILH